MSEKQTDKKPLKDPKKDKGGMGEGSNTVPNIKPTEIELPPLDPPVPNRAWTAMKDGCDKMNMGELTTFTEKERRGTFLGNVDNI